MREWFQEKSLEESGRVDESMLIASSVKILLQMTQLIDLINLIEEH